MILHKPSWDKNFAARREKQADVDAAAESVVSSICLAAVYSCNSEEASAFFSEDKLTLQRRHRLATERALVKAFEADCPSLTALQAFAIYLSIVVHDDNKKIMKDLLKLAMDVAQRMGLDDEHCLQSKSPLNQDLTRRLWWTFCKLCLRSSDRKSLGCYMPSRRLEMQLPLNISDEDIHDRDLYFPTPRLGQTSMTFNLIEWEITRLQESLTKAHGVKSPAGDDHVTPIQTQLDAIEKCHMNLQVMYLCHLDESRPFDWMTLLFTRMHLARLRLLVEFPTDSLEFIRMSEESRVRIFEHSLCILQTLVSLRSDIRITQWSWLFSRLVEWQAMSYVARMLNCSSLSANSIQAWSLLETLLQDESMQRERWNDLRTLISHSIRSRASFQEDVWLYGETFATYDQDSGFPNEQEGYPGGQMNTMPGLDYNLCEPLQSVGISPDDLQFSHPQTPDFDVGATSLPERKVRDDWAEIGWHTPPWWPATPTFEELVSLQPGAVLLS
ncbi:hypothetical protein QM012_007018 [Aureobasidium pullulans]|uniref:Xylanolytic transcriptional activator regulatory domain-containing protein n=1 Tax=Aureobasidium pullulans TaxID=5580 RepID=A0ABR0TQ88_AURPU